MPENHTPTPWVLERPGQPVGSRRKPIIEIVHRHETIGVIREEANAALIVLAVNAHDALVAERTTLIAAIAFALGHPDTPTSVTEKLRDVLTSTLGKDSA